MHTLSVLGSSWARLLDSAHGLLSSSWTFYLQADDGRVVVFQVRAKEIIVLICLFRNNFNFH